MGSMRSALVLATVLGLAGCTAQEPPRSSIETPSGPCAKTREQPPEGSQEQRLQADLDGDGRTDEVVSWLREGERVVQAWLATGENAEPQQLFEGMLLDAGDVDGDGRDEAFVERDASSLTLLVLDGCSLAQATLGELPFEVLRADGPLLCRGAGVVEQLRRPRDPQEAAQGQLVTRRFRVAGGAVTDLGQSIAQSDVRTDDLETADAPVICP